MMQIGRERERASIRHERSDPASGSAAVVNSVISTVWVGGYKRLVSEVRTVTIPADALGQAWLTGILQVFDTSLFGRLQCGQCVTDSIYSDVWWHSQ